MNRQLLEQPFSPEQVKERKGSFGKSLAYVEGHTVIQRLNEAFDGDWSFEIMSHEVMENEVIVLGRLSAAGIIKVQFGSSQITRMRDTQEPISIADDLKAAATDALKKAATLLGVGLHLYTGKTVMNDSIPPAPEKKGVGENGSNGNGNGRLSQKQHTYILSLADQQGISRKDLNQMTLERYSVNLEFLTRTDASSFIGELLDIAA